MVLIFLYDFVALHSLWRISKGLICLSTSGNYAQVEILTGNSWEKFYQFTRTKTNLPSTRSQVLSPQNTH